MKSQQVKIFEIIINIKLSTSYMVKDYTVKKDLRKNV